MFNERPVVEEGAEAVAGGAAAGPAVELPHGAIIRTTRGDIWVKLFGEEVRAGRGARSACSAWRGHQVARARVWAWVWVLGR